MISDRPTEAADRAAPGHWEGDPIIGKDGGSAIGTLVERSTRYTVLLHLPGRRTAEAVCDALAAAVKTLPSHLVRSLTWDQGAGMASHGAFSLATGIPVYFCDPASPWQRGSNENTNGLLRQYFPKGTDLAVHGPGHLAAVAAELNSRPRKTCSRTRRPARRPGRPRRRAESSPTAVVLGKLSAALELSIAELLAPVPPPGAGLVRRAADVAEWRDPDTGYLRRQLSTPRFPVAVTEVVLPTGARVPYPGGAYAFIAQLVWVLSGWLILADGPDVHELSAGDTFELGEPRPREFRNDTAADCRYLVVVTRKATP
jgi:hypothetical protein